MAESADHRRILKVTPGNLRQHHLYVREHLDFFPADCVGPPRRHKGSTGTTSIEIDLDGLNRVVRTDIGADAATGKARGFFRGRSWVGAFFKHHGVTAGDELALVRIAPRRYRLALLRNGSTNSNGHGHHRTRVTEFFAGIGLVRLALEHQGWQVVFANDIDPAKAEMYRQNWPGNDHLVVGDIHRLTAEDIPDCELATASFPCNDLSIAGRWDGLDGKESSAFWAFVRILRELEDRRPPTLLIENVVGFLQRHGGHDFERALVALSDLGYCVDALILNASSWVPQSRPRLFVVAKAARPDGERRTVAPISAVRPELLTTFIFGNQNIRWDICDLPDPPRRTLELADIVERLPDDDPHWWNADRADYFMNQLSERHAEAASRMITGKRYSYATAFRRVRHGKSMAELRTDGLAGCLRTPRGGSGRQILFKAGRGRYQVRLLTARECARLQGVPDSYKINVPLNKALFGFGDAVCVPVIEWIAASYVWNC